jgi:predicted transcriptional regulator
MYMSEIAREFGVSETTIRAIKTGRTWKEVQAGDSRKRFIRPLS